MADGNKTHANLGWRQFFPGAGPTMRMFSGVAAQLDVVVGVRVMWNGVSIEIAKVREPAPVWRALESIWKGLDRLNEGRVFYPQMDSAPPKEAPCKGDCDSGSCMCTPCIEKRIEG